MLVYQARVHDYIQVSIALARDALRKSYDLLRTPKPDTFVGRKTQEPFACEHDDPHIELWLTSKELRPPR